VIHLAEDVNLLKKILDELREIKYWVKVSSLPVIRRAAYENLRDDESKLVYELSDGQRSTREIAEELKKSGIVITHATVANMWKRWVAASLVEPSERYKGRFRKVAPLESFGMEPPEISKKGEEIR
jgi:hypothetical protein